MKSTKIALVLASIVGIGLLVRRFTSNTTAPEDGDADPEV